MAVSDLVVQAFLLIPIILHLVGNPGPVLKISRIQGVTVIYVIIVLILVSLRALRVEVYL
jgi:hypothetical protein